LKVFFLSPRRKDRKERYKYLGVLCVLARDRAFYKSIKIKIKIKIKSKSKSYIKAIERIQPTGIC